MDEFSSNVVANVVGGVAIELFNQAGGSLRRAWSGEPQQQALRRATQAALLALESQITQAIPERDKAQHVFGLLAGFLQSDETAKEVTRVLRAVPLDNDRLIELFAYAGYDAETLGFSFATALNTFAMGLLQAAISEPELQGAIRTGQLLEQTNVQRQLLQAVEKIVALLREQPQTRFGIEAGTIQATNVVNGQQILYSSRDAAEQQATTVEQLYLRGVLQRCDKLNLTGINPQAHYSSHALTSVYTALRTWASDPEKLRHRLAQKEQTRLEEMSALEQLNKYPYLVLIGDPGSGKSSFLNFVLACLAGESLGERYANLALLIQPLPADDVAKQKEQPNQKWEQGALFPVLLILRDMATHANFQKMDPMGFFWMFLAESVEKHSGCEDVRVWLQNRLTQHAALICFDGLDEVPDAEQQRDRIKAVIEKVAETLPKARIVVTSRPYAYQHPDWQLKLDNRNRFATATLTPFSWGQIRLFVERWYAYVGQALKPENRTGQAIHLQQRIEHNKNLRELAASPLLLTLIADLHHYRGNALPENRQLLYKEATDLLLDRWEEQRVEYDRQGKISRVLQPSLQQYLRIEREELLFLLQELAYTVHTAQAQPVGTADLERSQLLTAFYDHHQQLKKEHPIDQAELLRYLHERSGILIARSETVFTFPHRTFQEYLAATYLTLTKDAIFLTELVRKEPSRWREVALLTIPNRNFGVWELVRELCGKEEKPLPEGKLWSSHIAGQLLVEQGQTKFEALSESQQESYERVRQRLIAILTDTRIPPRERAEAGDALARLGDPRPGVGVRADGLPDLAWGTVIPAGNYTIGDKSARESDEKLRPAIISAPYQLARYPITNAQFDCFLQARDVDDPRWWAGTPKEKKQFTDPQWPIANRPRENVSWYQAVAFCRWLSHHLKETISLPHEYQWEVAARYAGNGRCDKRTYPWGDEPITAEHANYEETKLNQTSAVGLFPLGRQPDSGLDDLSGNVWEWCVNKYESDDGRTLRGGSWYRRSLYCRAAYRFVNHPDNRSSYLGFRVVRVPPSPPER